MLDIAEDTQLEEGFDDLGEVRDAIRSSLADLRLGTDGFLTPGELANLRQFEREPIERGSGGGAVS